MDRLVGRGGDLALGDVRRQHRKSVAAVGHGLGRRDLRFLFGEDTGFGGACQHAVARGFRRGGIAVGAAAFRRLRQRDEQRGLRRRQPPRLLAEIGERGGADAFDVAAIGRERQVEVQDRVLVELSLQRQRRQHLREFSADRARRFVRQEPRHLHGDGRGAGDRAAVPHELERGAEERLHIDAAMLAEAPVLVGDQRFDEERIDFVERGVEPPASVGGGEGAEEDAVAVEDEAAGFGVERRELDAVDTRFSARSARRGR